MAAAVLTIFRRTIRMQMATTEKMEKIMMEKPREPAATMYGSLCTL